MTKQEMIREGIAERLYRRASLPSVNIPWNELTPFTKDIWLHQADSEMEWLHSQGLVIYVGSLDCRDYEDDILEPLIEVK